jgi:hypothetical protein
MLLDDYLPTFDVRASYTTCIAASPGQVYGCLRTAAFDHVEATHLLFALRALPSLPAAPRETWRRVRAELEPRRVILDDLLARGFSLLDERPDAELLLGTVAIFWRAREEFHPTSPAAFCAPIPPGTAKAAWSFTVQRRGDRGTELRTETRIVCADAGTRRRFRVYWWLINPGFGLIRREMLAAVRDAAEGRCTIDPARRDVRTAEEFGATAHRVWSHK